MPRCHCACTCGPVPRPSPSRPYRHPSPSLLARSSLSRRFVRRHAPPRSAPLRPADQSTRRAAVVFVVGGPRRCVSCLCVASLPAASSPSAVSPRSFPQAASCAAVRHRVDEDRFLRRRRTAALPPCAVSCRVVSSVSTLYFPLCHPRRRRPLCCPFVCASPSVDVFPGEGGARGERAPPERSSLRSPHLLPRLSLYPWLPSLRIS